MANSRPLLDRLLNAPDLAQMVPHLQPAVLHRVIRICGLEDCAGLVALATTDQLASVLDLDLWRARPGGDEELDVDRFGVWLEVLIESGATAAVQKLVGLDFALVVSGLARHLAVFECAAASSYTTSDGEAVAGRAVNGALVCEIGGYVLEARRTSAWDAIVELLVVLVEEQPEYFHRLMRECVRLSNGTREADGFYDLLPDRDQDMFDLACDREARREREGYVSPAQARAFLEAARRLEIDSDRPPRSALARAYLRAIEPAPPAGSGLLRESGGALPASSAESVPAVEAGPAARVLDVLGEAGVLTRQPLALLAAPDGATSRLVLIRAYVESHPASPEELAYLANTIVAGGSIQGRPFTTREASDAAAAICNLGLDKWPERWRDRDLVSAFQVGWTVLHRDVCMLVAERLIDVIADIRCKDRDITMRLRALRRDLLQHVRDRAPWRARNALDVMLMLDAPAWAALLALIDECPVMNRAVAASRRACRTINARDFEFISERSQIAAVREFVDALPSMLNRHGA